MSFITRKRKSGTWELRIKHSLLEAPEYRSFDSEADAVKFAKHCHDSLDQGIVPIELKREKPGALLTIGEAVRKYKTEEVVARSTSKVLVSLVNDIGEVPLRETTLAWCKDWVRKQKLVWLRKPNTIRHHVIALRTIFTWLVVNYPECLATNSLLLLERAYSRCNSNEQAILIANGHEILEDAQRNRRISEEEQASILQVIAQLADNTVDPTERHAFESARVLFLLALESAMRMREIYTLEYRQVNLSLRTAFLEKTKNGDHREVPLSSKAVALINEYLPSAKAHCNGNFIFPFCEKKDSPDAWANELERCTSALSKTYRGIFEAAGCDDLHFHDTRHEGTCRIVLTTTLTDTQISRITGHKDPKMLRLYTSLRGSELAAYLP